VRARLRRLILVSLDLMPAAVVLLVLIAISAPVVCRGEHAEPTGTQERETTRLLMRGRVAHDFKGIDLEKWNERVRLSEKFG